MTCATNGATPSPPKFDANHEDAVHVSRAPAQWWKSKGLVSVGVKLNLGQGAVICTLPRDWQTVPEPLPLQD
jgi:hypothetical protein